MFLQQQMTKFKMYYLFIKKAARNSIYNKLSF